MIKPGEIQNKAREIGVRDQQIEKDYVLSWIIQGISQHAELSKIIAYRESLLVIVEKCGYIPMCFLLG